MNHSIVLAKAIVITLVKPIWRFLATNELPSSRSLWIGGIATQMEESPFAVPADLLVEEGTREFVGVTYEIPFPDRDLRRAKQMASSLSPDVVRINDFSTPELQASYPAAVRSHPYFEIIWARRPATVYECAQLEYGAWGWFYASEAIRIGPAHSEWTPPLAFGLHNAQEVIRAYDLKLPTELGIAEGEVR